MNPGHIGLALVLLLGPVAATAQVAASTQVATSAQVASHVPEDEILRPGDVVRLTVWRHPEMSGEFVIAADSTLIHPLYQTVKVAGVPAAMVKQRLRTLLATYEQDVQLVVEPLFPVTVTGEVRQPNLYRLPRGTTFAQAVALAGGASDLGRLDRVRVIRKDHTMTLDLAGSYAKFDTLTINSGDQVMVARRSTFSILRDVLVPVSSITAAVVAVLVYSRH